MRYYKHVDILHKIVSGTHYWFQPAHKEWLEDKAMRNRHKWKFTRKDRSFKWIKESDLMLEML